MRRVYAGLLGLFALASVAGGQAPAIPVALAWDQYTGGAIDGFVLERKTGQGGTYAPLTLTIAATATTATDTTPVSGQIYCWRLLAKLGTYKSPPSNEVCNAVLIQPLNLRVQ